MPMKNINYLFFLQPTGLFFSSKFNLLHFFLENFWSSTKFVWTYIFFNFPTKNILFSGFDGKNHWFIAKKGRRFRTKIFQVIKIWFCSRPATFSRKTKRYVQDFLPLEGEEACMCCMPICESPIWGQHLHTRREIQICKVLGSWMKSISSGIMRNIHAI